MQLLHDLGDGAAQRELHLLALGDVLVERVASSLDREAGCRCRARRHAPVHLEQLTTSPDDVAGALVAPGEEAADHHRARAGADRGRDVTGAPDPAIRDQRDPDLPCRCGAFEHRRELRHPDPCDQSRRAGEAGADADLDRIGAGGREIGDAVARGDVARNHVDVGPGCLQLGDRLDRGIGMPVRDVEDERVHLGRHELTRAIEIVASNPDRGRNPEATERVAGRARVAVRDPEIAERDETGHPAVAVHERELLDPASGQQPPCLVEGDPGRSDDQAVARRHQCLDVVAVLAGEQVAGGEQAEQPAVGVDDDESGDRRDGLPPTVPPRRSGPARPCRAPSRRA